MHRMLIHMTQYGFLRWGEGMQYLMSLLHVGRSRTRSTGPLVHSLSVLTDRRYTSEHSRITVTECIYTSDIRRESLARFGTLLVISLGPKSLYRSKCRIDIWVNDRYDTYTHMYGTNHAFCLDSYDLRRVPARGIGRITFPSIRRRNRSTIRHMHKIDGRPLTQYTDIW